MSNFDEILTNFEENFNPSDYLKEIQECCQTQGICLQIGLTFLYDVVKSGRFAGSKCLEIGCGPTVHNVASASAHYPVIVQSDLLRQNRDEVRKWLEGESGLDWSCLLDFVAGLEDCRGNISTLRKQLDSRIRDRVRCVVPCNLLDDHVIDPAHLPDGAGPPYDLVISCLCLECACSDAEGFVRVLKRVANLLRVGGGLVMYTFANCQSWKVGDVRFHCAKLGVEDMLSCMDEAGFGRHDCKKYSPVMSDYYVKYEHFVCIATEKL